MYLQKQNYYYAEMGQIATWDLCTCDASGMETCSDWTGYVLINFKRGYRIAWFMDTSRRFAIDAVVAWFWHLIEAWPCNALWEWKWLDKVRWKIRWRVWLLIIMGRHKLDKFSRETKTSEQVPKKVEMDWLGYWQWQHNNAEALQFPFERETAMHWTDVQHALLGHLII